MAEQLGMQTEDYQQAMKKGEIFVCNVCQALTISTCEDVKRGVCFYCGSKNVSWDRKKVKSSFDLKVEQGAL